MILNFTDPFFTTRVLGFEPLFDRLQRLSESSDRSSSYPPYNIRKDGNHFAIEIAVAGLTKNDIEIELADGTMICQGPSIMQYIGDVYPQFRGADAATNAKADSVAKFTFNDMLPKVAPAIFSGADDRVEKLKAVADEWVPKWSAGVCKFLSDDKKFLAGDHVTIYDFQVAGFIVNLFRNPNAKDAALWATYWETVPDRLKKYEADFVAEMKDYLDARPKDCTL